MKSIFRNIIAAMFGLFALGLFTARFLYRAEKAAAQSPSSTGVTAFELDVEEGQKEVANDVEARHNQQEIDDEDIEEAGRSEQDRTIVIDGEEQEVDIEDDIQHEVDIEDESEQENLDSQDDSDGSDSLDNGSSTDTETETDDQLEVDTDVDASSTGGSAPGAV